MLVRNEVQVFTQTSTEPLTTAITAGDITVTSRAHPSFSYSLQLNSENMANSIPALSCAMALLQDGVCVGTIKVKGSPRYLGITLGERSFSQAVNIKPR